MVNENVDRTGYYTSIPQMAAVSIPIWFDLASLTSPTNRRRLWTGVGRANSSPSAEKCRIFCHRDALLLWFAASAWKIAPYAVDVMGGGRSSAISRRMSANKCREMATSAIWNAT